MRGGDLETRVLGSLLGLAMTGLLVFGIAMLRTEARPLPQRIPPPPQFDLVLSPDAEVLVFSGIVDFGLTRALERMLADHPTVRRLVLDSDGGYIAEARGAVRVLRAHAIATHVETHCASACALIFAAGAARSLGAEARLGLHGYALLHGHGFGLIDPVAEMQRDLAIYRAQSVDEAFISRLAGLPQSPMWYPDHAELRAAGLVTLP